MESSPKNLSEGLAAFLKYKTTAIRPTTLRQYVYLCRLIAVAWDSAGYSHLQLTEITLEHLVEIVHLLDKSVQFPGVGETTVKKVVKYFKQVFPFCRRRGWIVSDPAFDLEFRRVHPQETQPFTEEECHALLCCPARTPAERRDAAMWALMMDTGVRVDELVNLKLSSIKGRTICVENGKGGKARQIGFGEHTATILTDYLTHYRTQETKSDHLFLGLKGQPLTTDDATKRLKKWASRAGVAHTAPHRFRATFATRFVETHGEDLLRLQLLLGHTTLDMARRYVKLARKQEAVMTSSIRSVVDQLSVGVVKTPPVENASAETMAVSILNTPPASPVAWQAIQMQMDPQVVAQAMALGLAMLQSGVLPNAFLPTPARKE